MKIFCIIVLAKLATSSIRVNHYITRSCWKKLYGYPYIISDPLNATASYVIQSITICISRSLSVCSTIDSSAAEIPLNTQSLQKSGYRLMYFYFKNWPGHPPAIEYDKFCFMLFFYRRLVCLYTTFIVFEVFLTLCSRVWSLILQLHVTLCSHRSPLVCHTLDS